MRRSRKEAQMRGAPHHHHIDHTKGKMRGVRLRNVGDTAGNLGAGEKAHGHTVDEDLTRLSGQQAQNGLEERGLARAVGPKQADNLTGSQLDVDVPAHGLCSITKAKSARSEYWSAHDQPSRPRANSHKKNGAPMTAVKIPIGTSMRAMVRAMVSTSNR